MDVSGAAVTQNFAAPPLHPIDVEQTQFFDLGAVTPQARDEPRTVVRYSTLSLPERGRITGQLIRNETDMWVQRQFERLAKEDERD